MLGRACRRPSQPARGPVGGGRCRRRGGAHSIQRTPYTYLQVRGKTQLIEDGATEHVHRPSHRYLDRNYPFLTPGTVRVTVRTLPDMVNFAAVDHGGELSGYTIR